MSNTNYDYVYNVGLLDDLHNYFPAFLYDSGRFQTPVQVFSYLRSQLNSRFNLPNFGARLAGFSAQTQPQTQTQAQAQARTTAALTTLLTGLLDVPASPIYTDYTYYTIPRSFMDPVPVTPSHQVMSSNTRIITGESGLCTICQDTILPTESCRRLTNCRHVYHTVCIDQWFQTNVQCPVCRMDIRGSVDIHPASNVASNAASNGMSTVMSYTNTRHLSTMAYLSNWNSTQLSTMSNVNTMAYLSTMAHMSTMANWGMSNARSNA